MKHKLYLTTILIIATSCAHRASQPDVKPQSKTITHDIMLRQHRPIDLKLDEKAKSKVNDAFTAVLNNDDKKAKLAYGRGYKFMPELVQFAFDLRFKNFDHALELLPKLDYTSEEKEMWKRILSSKPKSIHKAICDELEKRNF